LDATIVIPTYNRREALLETLRTLERVEYPPASWETVVVDDGSTDGTEAAVAEWLKGARVTGRFLRQANAGPAAARNRGAAAARGKVLVFIDNDILVSPSFLRDHLDAHAARPGCWVVGRITHPEELRRTPFGRYRDSLWEQFHRARTSDGPADTDGMSAANVSLPRADFERFGGFDTDFTIASSEDWDLGFRARQAGVRILYHPGIVVIHNDWAVSLDRFCERQRLYSKSDVLLWRKYGSASPRAGLIRANGPVRWRKDPLALVARKVLKRALAGPPCRQLVRLAAWALERVVPDTRLSRRAYDLAVALAIFRGVREGWVSYPPAAPETRGPTGRVAPAGRDAG
jgi:GT2 family glycosyltransferase